ncbi:putative signaling protein [Ferriphaselus amnicola]|uniref:Putative signaling protein n=1 Tax=Ferriphaselus amnicola TaxID=1188319 RepID=A0A2Z6GAI2_9PROT|nr:EAL domain-containing protein [Ferriphaselus amnicola]BBE50483.1 putative signaling protein [Ferriphaselus amnicola]
MPNAMTNQPSHSGSNGQPTLLLEIATRDVVRLSPDDTIAQAASSMSERRISSILVTDADSHPLGIVTERNMLQAMQSGCPPSTALREVMSAPVITMPQSTAILDAYHFCRRNGIRHLAIVDDSNALLGVVSETDFRHYLNLSALAGRRKVTSLARGSAIALPPATGLMQALDLMQAQRKSCVVVIEGEKPIGIVTERDVVRFYSRSMPAADITLGAVMTAPVLTISHEASINQAAEKMLVHKVRHLVMVNKYGLLAGLLSEHDLTQTLVSDNTDMRDGVDENFLRTLINTLPDLVWLKDLDGVYLACNHRFERFFGAREADIVGKTDYDFMPREIADAFREFDRHAVEMPHPSVNEEWVTYADDGHRELLETIKTPMHGNSGQMIGVLGIARDITLRKRIEDALYFVSQKGWKGSEKFLDALARYLGEALGTDYVIIDKLSDDPEYAETVALYARGEIAPNIRYLLPGTPCANVVSSQFCCYPEQVQRQFPNDSLLVDMGVESYAGIPLWAADGRAIGLIAVLDGKPMRDPNLIEQLLKIVASRAAAELEREAAHRALQQSEQEFRTLADHMPDNMVRYDALGAVRYMNPAFVASIAQDIRPEIGKVTAAAHPDYAPAHAFQRLIEQVVRTGEPATIEMSLPAPDGELRSHFIRLVPERDQDDNIIGALAIGRDVTEQNRAHEQLQKEKQFVDDVINSMPGIFYLLDPQGRFLKVNRHFLEVSGYTQAELDGITALDLFEGSDRQLIAERISDVFKYGSARVEAGFRTKSGKKYPYLFSGHLTNINGANYLVGVGMDISERTQAEEALRIYASVFETSQEAIILSDADNTITDVNPAFTRITGYQREEVIGKNPRLLSSGRHARSFFAEMWEALERNLTWRGEMWNRRKSGELYAELLSISVIQDKQGHKQRHVGVFSDISRMKAHEAELSRVANHDMLTGLPNRRLLADRLNQSIVRAQRSGKILVVCYLDLDGFKQVNDEFGHETGDQLLIVISHRLQAILRADDTLARLGGDEFVMLFNELSHEQECLFVLDRILEAVSTPVPVGTNVAKVSASLGVTFYPVDHEDGDTLLRHADQAMYIAKQHGKNRYHLYDSHNDQQVRSQHNSRQRVALGLENGEFELYFQPKIDLTTGTTTGAEALIRWHHPEEGMLLPKQFLPLIESSSVEIQLGEWVMDNALYQLDCWHQQEKVLELSVNISAHHLQSPGFVDKLARRLRNHPHIPRNSLQIEVLETAALSDIEQTSKTINACRELGVTFALDDFGTGYSSLAYLRKLSAETLKIDQSFVINMLNDDGDKAIVEGIIALAQTFGRKTVAEGIEQTELAETLRLAGCDFGQGFGFAHPMPAHEFLEWLAKKQ